VVILLSQDGVEKMKLVKYTSAIFFGSAIARDLFNVQRLKRSNKAL